MSNSSPKLHVQQIPVGEHTLFVRFSDKADKIPLILVHGLGISGVYMEPVGEYLAENYSLYIPDLPGFGQSSKPKQTLSLSELAAVLVDLTQTLGFSQAIFLGNSFGCQIIAELAQTVPDKVKALILVGPTVDKNHRNWIDQARALHQDSKLEPKWQEKAALKDYQNAGVGRLLKTAKISMNDQIEDKLKQIKVPTLVVRGTKDPFVSKRWAQEVTAFLENGQLVEIPHKGHTLNSNAPEQLASVVDTFVSRLLK